MMIQNADWLGRPDEATSLGWTAVLKTQCPQQKNLVDCGVYVCMFAYCFINDIPIAPAHFTQTDDYVDTFRKRIAASILRGELL